jgi:iron complex outermembrane receptor protein
MKYRAVVLVSAFSLGLGAAWAHATPRAGELLDLSLEQLGDLQVTSVSKRAERIAEAPASIFVITAEDLRRDGARTLAEALRLAPNLHVAQTSSSGYAISARGMNGSNTSAPNRLLVMIDGRSVYSPLFSGVFWDVQDVVLEDVDRIEVVSGPGSTLWGVNAVNGVINVITRSAAATRGPLVALGAAGTGSDAVARYGGGSGAWRYRLYAKTTDLRQSETAAGPPIDDAGHKIQAGFRAGWENSQRAFDLHGNIYRGSEGQPEPGSIAVDGVALELGDIEFSGHNLTGRWVEYLGPGARFELQAYLDRTERTVPPTFAQRLDLFDLELRHSLAPIGAHSLAWGFNYRRGDDRVRNSPYFAFLPADLEQEWSSLYLQDQIALGERLDAIVGTRLERNDYTGTEALPSLRLAWRLRPEQMLWGAASRAVRAPSRLDHDAYIPGAPPFLLDGGREVGSEIADVYEVGWRGQSLPHLSYSMTLFHADYDHLRSVEIAPSGTHLVFGNLMRGRAYGLEAWGNYQVTERWRLSAGASALREKLWLAPGGNDVTGPAQSGNDPRHTWQLRSRLDLPAGGEFDLALRHVDALRRNAVPSYTVLDAHYGWNLGPATRLVLSARNLGGSHAEYGPLAFRAEHERSFEARLVWTP